MKRVSLILLSASLTGCFGNSTEQGSLANLPVPPELTQTLAAPCPPLALLTDKQIGTLVTEDANAAVQYAECSTSKSAVVSAYNDVRQEILNLKAKLKEKP